MDEARFGAYIIYIYIHGSWTTKGLFLVRAFFDTERRDAIRRVQKPRMGLSVSGICTVIPSTMHRINGGHVPPIGVTNDTMRLARGSREMAERVGNKASILRSFGKMDHLRPCQG